MTTQGHPCREATSQRRSSRLTGRCMTQREMGPQSRGAALHDSAFHAVSVTTTRMLQQLLKTRAAFEILDVAWSKRSVACAQHACTQQ